MEEGFWEPAVKALAFALLMGLSSWYGYNSARKAPREIGGRKIVAHPHGYAFCFLIIIVTFALLVMKDNTLKYIVNDLYFACLLIFIFSIFVWSICFFQFYRIEFNDSHVYRTWLWSTRSWGWEEAVEISDFIGTPTLKFSSGQSIYVSNLARGYRSFIEHAKLRNVKISERVQQL